MKWTVLLFIGFWTNALYAQTNPDPAVSHPVVCKNGGDAGPAGTCVPFDPNNPEHRKLLDKMNQTRPDGRSAPPVQPPPPPDPVTSLAPTDFQIPPLITAPTPAIAPKPQTNTATEPYCDLACSQAKLHQFDTPSSQPGQAPPGAGALWGVSQALHERQVQSHQQDTQLQNALRDETFVSDMLALRMDISVVAHSKEHYPDQPLPLSDDVKFKQEAADDECQTRKEGQHVTTVFNETWVCYQSRADGHMHATELNLPGGGAADLRRWTKGFTAEQMQELRGRVCERPHLDYIEKLMCYRK
jgi:hypothetical protein